MSARRVFCRPGPHSLLDLSLLLVWMRNVDSFFSYKQSAIIVWIKWWFCSFTDMNSQYTIFYISQGSTVTILRWGGQIIYHLMPNFLRLPYTKKLVKWVDLWLSYYKNKKAGVFLPSSVVTLAYLAPSALILCTNMYLSWKQGFVRMSETGVRRSCALF